MANNHSTLTGLFTDIADAIRVKTGSTVDIIADNFPEAIAAIETGENLDTELATQDALIAQIATALEGKTGASGGTNVVSINVKTEGVGYGAIVYYINNSFELVELQATANAVQIEAVGGIVISNYDHKAISGGIYLGYIYMGPFIYAFHSNDGSLVLYGDRIES